MAATKKPANNDSPGRESPPKERLPLEVRLKKLAWRMDRQEKQSRVLRLCSQQLITASQRVIEQSEALLTELHTHQVELKLLRNKVRSI